MNALVQNSAAAVAVVRKEMRTNAKNMMNGLQYGRSILSSADSVEAHAAAYSQIVREFDALTDQSKRDAFTGKEEIRVDMKLQSDAVSAEKVKLRKETNDDQTAQDKLYAKFPLRIKKIKGCYVVLTHAEFDAKTANMKGPKVDAETPDASESGDESGDTAPTTSKTDLLIATLRAQIVELTSQLAERDATIAKMNADLDDALIAALTPTTTTIAKIPAGKRARKTAKVANAA